jgi:hypothetical protein
MSGSSIVAIPTNFANLMTLATRLSNAQFLMPLAVHCIHNIMGENIHWLQIVVHRNTMAISTISHLVTSETADLKVA